MDGNLVKSCVKSSYVITYHVRILSNNPLNPPPGGVGKFILVESQSRIYSHMHAKFGRGATVVSKKGAGTDTQIMKLLQVCEVQYCQQCVNF